MMFLFGLTVGMLVVILGIFFLNYIDSSRW